jgi:hypothetical protein
VDHGGGRSAGVRRRDPRALVVRRGLSGRAGTVLSDPDASSLTAVLSPYPPADRNVGATVGMSQAAIGAGRRQRMSSGGAGLSFRPQ